MKKKNFSDDKVLSAKVNKKEKKESIVSKVLPPTEKSPPIPVGFPIVGIGASAGGLKAFEEFFSGMPVDTDPNMAFVLVQHLARDHKSLLTELIRRYTRMEVFEVVDGMVVKPNCAYIIPPNCDMAFMNGTLQLMEPSSQRGLRLPIDFFFRSLAQDQQERAICIVLSGTGSDGTLGVRAIKGEGGMVMAQTPESTEYNGMPMSAIATGLVDYELLPAEMPAQIIAYVAHAFGSTKHEASTTPLKIESTLKKIFVLLRVQTGHDFSLYKPNTIRRRIERRMAVLQIATIEEYTKYLQQNRPEVESLFRDILIGVTNFFRDPEVFAALEKTIIPKLFLGKSSESVIRVWIPGCSTGEEAYSIAILLQEHIDTLKQSYKVQIFATDIDAKAIAIARAGFYPASIAADITPERLSRFFKSEPDNRTHRINKNIRDMLVFSEQDLIKDPPFSKLDLLSCRNLMIYMGSELQKKLIPLFHYTLNPKGFLLLGTSENIGEYTYLFTFLDKKMKLYQAKENFSVKQRAAIGKFMPPLSGTKATAETLLTVKTAAAIKFSLRELTEQTLLQKVTPCGALVNDRGDILYLHGRTGHYLELSPGETGKNNIIKMAREGLRENLTISLRKAVASHETVNCPALKFKTNGNFSTINLSIIPIMQDSETTSGPPLYLVVFSEISGVSPEPNKRDSKGKKAVTKKEIHNDSELRIAALMKELQAKEEYLHTTNEELETTNEELKSSNEEMQSVNEELQSTNEELETSKEELQSVNEELSTVNAELHTKVADLSRVNNDMNNLIAGTGIATVFVDHQQKILRYTNAATHLINLIISDIGRPIGHIVSNLLGYNNLSRDVQTVLETLIPKELDVQAKDGSWYTMRIIPYRTMDNVIEGAVINFVNITESKKIENDLIISETRYRLLFESAKDGILILDAETGMIEDVNPYLIEMLGYSEEEFVKKAIWEIGFFRDIVANKEKFLELQEKKFVRYEDLPLETASGRKINVEFVSNVYFVENEKVIQCNIRDITDRKRAQDEIKNQLKEKEILLREVHHRIKNNIASLRGLLQLQMDETKDTIAISAFQDAIGRIDSMLVLYEKLLYSEGYKEISAKGYVESLLDSVLKVFPDSSHIRIEKEIDDFQGGCSLIFSLGVIINEVITNSMKYGFANRGAGLIRVTLIRKESHVVLTIQDDGNGLREGFDIETSTGFGLTLVKMLSLQLEGKIRMENEKGTKFILEFDLEK
ncbi:MAG: chemotaxis protein CheB [Ignavibacteriaceae bacterium]